MKIDFKKSLDSYQAKQGQFRLADVPQLNYLAIDGAGDPNTSQSYKDAISALYPVAYALKFASKKELDRDYVVMPLEGLWWADDMEAFTTGLDKSQWYWTAMIMVPDWTTTEMLHAAKSSVSGKNPDIDLSGIELRSLQEGLSVQTLHIGPYSGEEAVLRQLHEEFIPQNHLEMTGKHHEIYLSDVRKVAPEKLRTILRQPVVESQDRE